MKFKSVSSVGATSTAPSPNLQPPLKQPDLHAAARALQQASAALAEVSDYLAVLEARLCALEAAVRPKEVSATASVAPAMPKLPAIDSEDRTHVDTVTAAHWLNRRPQTLRKWATYEDGPIRPMRMCGRLMWSVADIRALLRGSELS